MIPALIDLNVRPVLNEQGQQDVELVAVQARDHGLDGVVVVGLDAAVDLGETSAVSAATGVQVFTGVALDTDLGMLWCYPRVVDDWFRSGGWRELPKRNGAGPAVYVGSDVVKAFAERGGAVVAAGSGDEALRPQGLAAVAVTAPGATALDDKAVHAAQTARLACIGASMAGPGDERFGAVATLFAAPPASQESMVEGLRSGRVWPVEIGAAWQARPAQQPQPARKADKAPQPEEAREPGKEAAAAAPARAEKPERLERAERPEKAHRAAKAEPQPKPEAQAKGGRAEKVKSRYDAYERPGDNRGNRLNRDELRRRASTMLEEQQPQFDPVAAMYGLDSRKIARNANKTDAELDRVNFNRAKGSDPNIMAIPSFEELRAERQHVSLLFSTPEEEHDHEDSIALRFAMTYYKQSPDKLAAATAQAHGQPQRRGKPQGRRRR